MEKIKIKYFSKDYPRLKKIEQGDWIDLRVDNIKSQTRWEPEVIDIDEYNGVELAEYWHDTPIYPERQEIRYVAGDILFLGLGVAMELPSGYEAHIVPRSSTFKKTGFILTNGIGIIDNSYSGDEDEWKAMVYCTRDGVINRFDRLFQFRIVKNQPDIEFEEVETLDNKSRGGYGSTDKVNHLYGMRLRRFSLGCQPTKGFIEALEAEKELKKYHNLLIYNRELTDEELERYELDYLGIVKE